MLNYIWAFMILAGFLYALFTGNLTEVNEGILAGGKDAVTVCLTMTGVLALWSGLMNVAKKNGIVGWCEKKIRPLIHGLFPEIPKGHTALSYISVNVIANFFGLGAAATPAGLKAMEELVRLEKSRRGCRPSAASDEMCTFLVLNISSIQLVPMTMISYRAAYGSEQPWAIVFPAVIATSVSTLAGILFCLFARKKRRRKGIPVENISGK